MKILKFNESKIFDEKIKEYQKYINKYVILEHRNNLHLAKFIKFCTNEYYVEIEHWDKFYPGYNIYPTTIHIKDFVILDSTNFRFTIHLI